MIPDIGLIIGIYAIVRLVSLITRTGDRSESPVVIILAILGIIGIGVCLYDLMATASKPTPGLGL